MVERNTSRGSRRGRRSLPRLLAALGVGALTVSLVLALTPSTSDAAFTATTGDGSNSWAAGTLAPPTSPSSSLRCNAPTVVAATSTDRTGGTVDLTVPASAVTGDLLLVQIANDNDSTPPAGWTLLNDLTAGGNFQSRLYQRIATAGDAGATYSFTIGGGKGAGGMFVLRNTAGLVDSGDAAGLDNANTSVISTPGMTTTVDSSLVLAFFGLKKAGESFSAPAGMTEAYDFGGGTISIAADHEPFPTAGATGTRSSTASAAATAIGQIVAVAPAATPEVDVSWTASASAWATGYEISRNGVVVATVTPGSATTWTDTAPGSGSTTYDVRSVKGSWRSTATTTNLTVACP